MPASGSPTAAATVQAAVNKYAKALKQTRLLFDLYPNPRPQGPPESRHRAIPPAVVQSVTAAFEGFAEELLVTALIAEGSSWAQIAAHANLTNPTLKNLCDALDHACGINVTPTNPSGPWKMNLWRTTNAKRTNWTTTHVRSWSDVLRDADSWMQVRHCLTHGLVSGANAAVWPAPVTKKRHGTVVPKASDVLHPTADPKKHSLVLYAGVNACLVYSKGGAEIAQAVAGALGESIIIRELDIFTDI